MNATAGINNQVTLNHLSPNEKTIVKAFSKEWQITYGGEEIELGPKSQYKYFLIKPTKIYRELFNISRELIVVFSDYKILQPRTLDAFDAIIQTLSPLRTEKIAMVLISNDDNIESEIQRLLRSDVERQVIVPFSYKELLQTQDAFFIKNRFRKHFFSRDLFAFNSALQKDFYFFGRNDLVHDIVSRVRSNEISGLFGLRKSGKTSIIFGIQRVLQSSNVLSIFIDCQSPGFHQKRWNNALYYIISEIRNTYFYGQKKLASLVHTIEDYTPENASECFRDDLQKIISTTKRKQILIIFDEIEHISPETASSQHWIKDNDFIYFWQTLRAIYQTRSNMITYMLVGTNPSCIEMSKINGIDNPIFNQIPRQYIPAFDVPQTKEMVKTLGGIMGMLFDNIIFAKLTEDFGGHPFLIRLVCSHIHNITKNEERPIRIDKTIYDEGKASLLLESTPYIEMILDILQIQYNEEYEMLKYLALGDNESFKALVLCSSTYTQHLLGYQIIDCNNERYSFKIEAVKQYLIQKHKYQKIEMTYDQKLHEISERRNKFEIDLRKIIRQILFSQYGEPSAKKKVIDILSKKKSQYDLYSLRDIFDPDKTEIYLDDLRKIINKEWSVFEEIFGRDRETFDSAMKIINKYRADCHAKSISDDEMHTFRTKIKILEDYIRNFF